MLKTLKTVNDFGTLGACESGSRYGIFLAPVEFIDFIRNDCYDGLDTPYFDCDAYLNHAMKNAHEWYTVGRGSKGENLYEITMAKKKDYQEIYIEWERPENPPVGSEWIEGFERKKPSRSPW
jgi:hypothetical protein